jgi:hypothetical protein
VNKNMSERMYLDTFDTVRANKDYNEPIEVEHNSVIANSILKLNILFNPNVPVFSQTQVLDSLPIINLLLDDNDITVVHKLLRDNKIMISCFGRKNLREALLSAIKSGMSLSNLPHYSEGGDSEKGDKKRELEKYLERKTNEISFDKTGNLRKLIETLEEIDCKNERRYLEAQNPSVSLGKYIEGYIYNNRYSKNLKIANKYLSNMFQEATTGGEQDRRTFYYEKIKKIDSAYGNDVRCIVDLFYNAVVCESLTGRSPQSYTNLTNDYLVDELSDYIANYSGDTCDKYTMDIDSVESYSKLNWNDIAEITGNTKVHGVENPQIYKEEMARKIIDHCNKHMRNKIKFSIKRGRIVCSIAVCAVNGAANGLLSIPLLALGIVDVTDVIYDLISDKDNRKYRNIKKVASLQLKRN